MKSIATGLTLAFLMMLSGCSSKANYIKQTQYLPCQNVKPLALVEPHPSRASLHKNRDLTALIDMYAVTVTLQNQRMVEIAAEVDDCMAKARASYEVGAQSDSQTIDDESTGTASGLRFF